MDEAVAEYIRSASKKTNLGAIDFFSSYGVRSKDRGSASAAWVRGMNGTKNIALRKKIKAEWESSSKKRKTFWQELEQKERDDAYCRKLEVFVVEDKINVGRNHSERIAKALSAEAQALADSTSLDDPATATVAESAPAVSPLSSSSTTSLVPSTGSSSSSSSSTPNLSTKKSTPLEEPWQTLQNFARQVALKRPVTIMEIRPGTMTLTRLGLFNHAYDSLILFNEDGCDPIILKDAFVALSCTLNLSGPDITSYFSKEILAAAEDALPYLTSASKIVKMMKPALDAFIASGMNVDTLLKETIRSKGKIVEERNTLPGKITDIIEYLCELILSPDMQSGESFSEAEVVETWKGLFKIFLRDTKIYSKSGETVIITSKDIQVILNREFGDYSPYGRKADMLFKSRTEMCNFEFKAEGTSPTDMMTQNRKNIRLNRCILENLRKIGVSSPRILFADIKGFSGCVFSLQAFEDIYTSKCVDYMSLPRNATELKEFLENGELISTLLAIVDNLIDTEQKANEALDMSAQAKLKRKLLDLYGSGGEKSPPRRERRFSSSIYLSPNK